MASAPKAAGTASDPTAHTLTLTPGQLAGLEKLREPFPETAIAKRPQISCGACKDASTKVCNTHSKATCAACGQYVTTAHKHLDYVGHAEATDRLLSVDPTWDWEPIARDDKGRPLIDSDGGMWITLTVCGMTRKGYGDAVGKRAGTTATKEIIGDAIRNAGMRFGMALDLWAKTKLHIEPPHPAEPFLEAIKTERVWMSSEWLAGVRQEADEAGQLDYVLPRGGGKTLGDIIDGQLAVLADAAERYAAMRIKADEERQARKEERAAVTAHVAASHPDPAQQPAPPAGQQPPPAGPPPADIGPKTAQQIRDACGPVWLDPDGLQRVLDRATEIRVINEPADPSKPRGSTLGQALQIQITELRRRAAQRTSTTQASDAAHQYAEHDDWGHTGDAAG
jgi:hypothetical protein